jgi:hypothetical protein
MLITARQEVVEQNQMMKRILEMEEKKIEKDNETEEMSPLFVRRGEGVAKLSTLNPNGIIDSTSNAPNAKIKA